MNNYLHRTLLISLILCATLFSSGLQAQIQITTKTLNSLRPAKADVKAIESGIENVQQQVANKGNAGQISGDITYLEEKVAKVRRDFKRFKKLPEWDASLAELKKQQAVLAGDQAAASKAKKDKNNAIYQLAYSLRNTGLESDIEKYRSNPEMKNAHEVVAGFSNLAQKLEKFRESYPNETEHKDVKRALDAESYVKGEFVSSYIGGLKEERVESDKLIASVRVEAPMRAERIVTKRISQGVKAVAAFPDQSYFSKMLETDRKLAKELKNYQENGDFEAYLLDQVRIEPAKARDAGVESGIRRDLEEEGYIVVVVSLQDEDWGLVKNEFGIPKYKVKDAVTGVRKDGQCYRIYGSYHLDYAGGGTYMTKGYYSWGQPRKMNCANLK